MNRVYLRRIAVCAAPFLLIASAVIFKPYIIMLGKAFPPCLFHQLTGLYCPGCGNTRSIIALLNGDIMLSLRCNFTPIVLIFSGLSLYLELVLLTFGIKRRSIVRHNSTMIIFVAAMLIYFAIRNFVPQLCPPDVGR